MSASRMAGRDKVQTEPSLARLIWPTESPSSKSVERCLRNARTVSLQNFHRRLRPDKVPVLTYRRWTARDRPSTRLSVGASR